MPAPIAFVLKGYPRLSETFIAQEIRALERRGLDLRLYSLRRPTDPHVHPVHREIRAPVRYLPEYLRDDPRNAMAALNEVRRLPGFRRARAAWWRDLRRDRTRNRARRFGQACVLAQVLPPDVEALHAHFLHTPASVTRYAALMRGLPWSVSAHAKDVWTIPDWEIREKLACCRWAVTCSRYTAEHLGRLAPDGERVSLIYHGLDLARFPAPACRAGPDIGSGPGTKPVRILSVGRAVEKKGYDVLIAALARLPRGLPWRLVHIGGGPLRSSLKNLADRAGLDDHILWMGPQPQEVVLDHYRSADIFVLASRIADDGDRDGLPNVLMEAQSQGLACLSTRVAAIPELVLDGTTGLLVAPDDPAVLARALERLIGNRDLRARLGRAGMRRVRESFSMDRGIERLAGLFGLSARGQTPPAEAIPCGSLSTHR